jgi:hypothetical protein
VTVTVRRRTVTAVASHVTRDDRVRLGDGRVIGLGVTVHNTRRVVLRMLPEIMEPIIGSALCRGPPAPARLTGPQVTDGHWHVLSGTRYRPSRDLRTEHRVPVRKRFKFQVRPGPGRRDGCCGQALSCPPTVTLTVTLTRSRRRLAAKPGPVTGSAQSCGLAVVAIRAVTLVRVTRAGDRT